MTFRSGEILNLSNEFNTAISYKEYIDLLGQYLSLHQLHYNKFVVDENTARIVFGFRSLKILVITEPWCCDSLALLPIIRKLAEINGRWEIKVHLRDSNPDLMNKFLTNGARAIPIFLFLDHQGDVLFKWGPRPKASIEIFEKHREMIKNGQIEKKEVIKKIRAFYAKDRGKTTLVELMMLFKEKNL